MLDASVVGMLCKTRMSADAESFSCGDELLWEIRIL